MNSCRIGARIMTPNKRGSCRSSISSFQMRKPTRRMSSSSFYAPGPSSLRSPANSGELRRTRRSLGEGGHPRHLCLRALRRSALVATTVHFVRQYAALRPLPPEAYRGECQNERVKDRQRDEIDPERIHTGAFEDDATQGDQKVARRHTIGDRSEKCRHA